MERPHDGGFELKGAADLARVDQLVLQRHAVAGWHDRVIVLALPDGDVLRAGADIENPRFWECTRKATKEQRDATGYVLLSYRGMRRPARRMVPAPAGLPLAVGERVYLNADACEQAIAKPAAS